MGFFYVFIGMIKIVAPKYMNFWDWLMRERKGYFQGQALCGLPILIAKEKEDFEDLKFVRHETIHVRQGIETLYIGLWLIYSIHFLINLLIYRNATKAYKNIVFEREAYDNDDNPDYLANRKLYSWFKYFKKAKIN